MKDWKDSLECVCNKNSVKYVKEFNKELIEMITGNYWVKDSLIKTPVDVSSTNLSGTLNKS